MKNTIDSKSKTVNDIYKNDVPFKIKSKIKVISIAENVEFNLYISILQH